MKYFTIVNNPDEIRELWPVTAFYKAYPEEASLKGCGVASLFDDKDPEKTSLVVLRAFVENGEQAKNDQKYVVGIRFYSFGDMATIDVISLNRGYHREICYEHLKRLGWPSWGEEMNTPAKFFDETTRAPFLFVGGHLQVVDGKVCFSGSSGDYGNKVLFSESNPIATYAAGISRVELTEGVTNGIAYQIGGSFVDKILEIMYEYKLKEDFYERLIRDLFQNLPKGTPPLTSQHVGALVTMKVIDRMIKGGGSYLELMVAEMFGGGLSRSILLEGAARKIRANEE